MACHLVGAKLLSEPKWNIVNAQLGTHFSEILYSYIFIQENALKNVVGKISAILFRPQYINWG